MNARTLGLARYRFARSLARARGADLALVLLLGVIGGTAMASLGAARATQSSYATLLAGTNPSDMNLTTYTPNITSRLATLPGVARVEAALFSFNVFPLGANGAPHLSPAYAAGNVVPMASVDGEFFNQDRVTLTAGRRADPRRADEFMATALAARLQGWRVGQRILFGFYTNAQINAAGFGTPAVRPAVERYERLTGTVAFGYQVIQDNVDRFPTWLLFTPAAGRPFEAGVQYMQYSLRLRGGAASVTSVEREIIHALPPGNTYNFHVTSVVEGAANRTLRPDALALGIFGAMALLGAILTAVQVIARQLMAQREDQESLRALGAPRVAVVVDSLVGVVASIVVGSFLAVGVAVLLSPLAPIGPVRAYLPVRFHLDGPVLTGGGLVLLVGAVGAALVLAVRWAPGRRGRLRRPSGGSHLARLGANAGMPASAVAGLHFAFEAGRGRSAVPVRSILVGVTLAVTMVGATLTFGSGLSTLVSHPPLYGWNWDYAIFGSGNLPPQSVAVVRASPLVKAWSPVNFANAQVDGLTVPIILVRSGASVSPPLLAGHAVENIHQIVLGAATMAALHKHLGDTVHGGYGDPHDYPIYVPQTRMRIVGVATLPAIGNALNLHTSMGFGAMIDINIEPPAFQRAIASPYATLNGPNTVLVRLRPGVRHAQALGLLRAVARAGNEALAAVPNGAGGGGSISWLAVQYPAEIKNYRSIGDTPLWLAMGFASGIVVAFALTIVASVRRRRRDLALLKTLGFTRRQLGAAIAWQASVSVGVGLLLGIPAGILLGRWLWDLFARQIYAVPDATVPALSLTLLCVGALAIANAVAYFPSRSAARTRAALALRAE
ncbi:MAG: FtsX-like permease family protein [Acidimicrobiales bacterium]